MRDPTYAPIFLHLASVDAVAQIFWGPLSFLVAILITVDHPLRHPFQALVSLGQLYGDILYYATSMFDHYFKGLSYCRPEAYYFWVYYFALNFIWIVIPSCEFGGRSKSSSLTPTDSVFLDLLYQSMTATAHAFRVASRSFTANGSLKKNA